MFEARILDLGAVSPSFNHTWYLNQIPYDDEVEVTDSRIRSDMWRTMDGGLWHCTGSSDQDHPQENEMQKGKRLSEEAYKYLRKKRS